MEMGSIFQALVFMLLLGLGLAFILAFSNRKFKVIEDPRIDEVEALLPGSNCGACGNPGCRSFAENLVAGKEIPAKCSVNSEKGKLSIAAYLGVEAGEIEKQVARLACGGGSHVARQRVRYVGLQSCRAATLVAGGGKGCAWGCLGLGDCGVACKFEAITFTEQGLPKVDLEKCTACGDCVVACPKKLFSIHPLSHQLWVNCKNQEFGDAAEFECEVACTACGKCVADAGGELLTMRNNLPMVDYKLNHFANHHLIHRCPTGAIGWIDSDNRYQSGAHAKRVIRTKSLPLG